MILFRRPSKFNTIKQLAVYHICTDLYDINQQIILVSSVINNKIYTRCKRFSNVFKKKTHEYIMI